MRTPAGGDGLVGLPLAQAEALLREHGKEHGVLRPLPGGAFRAMPFRRIIRLTVDEKDVVTDVSLG